MITVYIQVSVVRMEKMCMRTLFPSHRNWLLIHSKESVWGSFFILWKSVFAWTV